VLSGVLLTVGFAVVSIMAILTVVWVTMWQPEHPTLLNAWKPAVIDAADAVELLLVDAADEVEVEGVEDPAAIGRTEAMATVLDVGVVEVVIAAEVVEVLDDAAAEVVDELLVAAVDDVVKGTAGVGGASKRMNRAKLMVSGLLSDTVLPLLITSTVLTVSSGRGLGEHCGEALEFRLLGNTSLVTPSSTL
jgi:hypothetical protein